MNWQQRHKPLPTYRCEIIGCYEGASVKLVDHNGYPHLACRGHLPTVALVYSGRNDCLMVEA